MNVYDDPRYQKAMLRLTRLSPNNQGVVSALANDMTYRFADDTTRQELASRRQTSNTEYANDTLALRGNMLDNRVSDSMARLNLRRGAFDQAQDEAKRSSFVGVGDLIGSTWLGAKKLKADSELARAIYNMRY